jgi:hypothetical protein
VRTPASPASPAGLGLPAVGLLVIVSALLRGWAATRVPGPWFIPDEAIYAQLGQSLWSTGHFRILGATPDFFSLVYPAFIGLPLHLAGIARGYETVKWLQALAMSLAAVPVYLWGRTLVSEGWALAAAALTLCVPELGLTGFLLTEVLFYPLVCLTAWLMARALLRPALTRQVLVLAAIFVTALTRLQAIVLAPAFLLAGLLFFGLHGVRRLLPTVAALVVVAAAWVGLTLARGGEVLGAYQVTAGSGYDALEAFRFVVYHAADLALASGVVPAAALIALAQARDRSPEVRAFVAVTVSLTAAFVPLVGVYASRFSGRLEERNLIALVPLLFLAFAVWLERPRRVSATLLGCAGVAVLLLVTPWDRYVVPAVEPEAFSLIPLVEFRGHLAPYAAVVIVAAALFALALALPRVVPLALGLLLAAASVSAAHVAARQARGYQLAMVGSQHEWIDNHVFGPVLFLYGGELSWSAGAPVWTNVFWNDHIRQVDELYQGYIAGPIVHYRARVLHDGRIVVPRDHRPALRYVVAGRQLQLGGDRMAESPYYVLWRIDPPLRLSR